MLFVACAHIVAVAVLLSLKMDLPRKILQPDPPLIDLPMPPEPPPLNTTSHQPQQTHITVPKRTEASVPKNADHEVDTASGPTSIDAGSVNFGDALNIPSFPPQPKSVTSGVQLLTPESELRPPYPASKLLNEEETALRLRLTIDQSGRVIAVDPVGNADPIFLTAARKHLLAHWRYKPAMDDGRAIATSIVITLRFQLNG